VILLGGAVNALSAARSLARARVKVYALTQPNTYVAYSRYCTALPAAGGTTAEAGWLRYLLGPESDGLAGAVLLALCDAGIQIIADNRVRLLQRFRLDDSNPAAQLCMLNKLSTYQQATAAGVPTPKFWVVETRQGALQVQGELVYPLLVKPLFSHLYQRRFGKKFVVVNSFKELLPACEAAWEAGFTFMLVEVIPGPDNRLCSYYTYLDENSQPLFHFTKRVIRRYPAGSGEACYHITDWNPEVRDLGLRLFQYVGLRGLANVEFKRDDRDGRLKLIECNARYTAANCLVTASGFDLALFVYNRLTGKPQPPLTSYRTGLRLWYPRADLLAFRELRGKGQLTLWRWLASIAHPQSLPCWSWMDPLPTLVNEWRYLKQTLAHRLRKLLGVWAGPKRERQAHLESHARLAADTGTSR
jgi:predicted ATP-grasp superfamily ATP-dependent carboligase